MLGAWCASTARAARGRAVCVTPLGASAWPCAERVGGGGGLSRARAGTQWEGGGVLAPAYTQHTTTHSARWCHMLPSFCVVADVCQARGRCDDVPPGLGVARPGPLLDAHVHGGGSAAVVPRRCPLHPLTCHLHLLLSLVIPAPVQPHPHTDPKGDLSPSPSPQTRRKAEQSWARTHLSSARCSWCSHRGRSGAHLLPYLPLRTTYLRR